MTHRVERFFVVGLSFKKTDLTHRNLFAFNTQQCTDIYTRTDSDCLNEFFILSTCNRTEIYGFAPCEYLMTALLQQHAGCSKEAMLDVYIKEGAEAARHFFEVASGLDSQIPGDYEIISQIKSAFQLAKTHNRTNGYLEKLFNFSLQASKEVKNTTSFSDGTLSVSFAVVQQLMDQPEVNAVTILGAGETGELTMKYLRKFVPHVAINLVNRDIQKLHTLAEKYEATAFVLNDLEKALENSHALIVTTNAAQPVVYSTHLKESAVRIIYDLSVPQNVAKEVYMDGSVTIQDVDTISERINNTVQSRLAEVPKVESIIDKFTAQFTEWSFRNQYFSVADRVQHATDKSLTRKKLHSVFQQWHESVVADSSLVPYTERAQQSMMAALKNNFPYLLNVHSTEIKETTHACTTTGHAQQQACFMANRCCRVSAHPAW